MTKTEFFPGMLISYPQNYDALKMLTFIFLNFLKKYVFCYYQ